MKCVVLSLLVLAMRPCNAQTSPQNISSAQLQVLLNLPLDQAVQHRNTYKELLTTAYSRQIALDGRDCQTEAAKGQQSYNICMVWIGRVIRPLFGFQS
jgi:hypothetical protein